MRAPRAPEPEFTLDNEALCVAAIETTSRLVEP